MAAARRQPAAAGLAHPQAFGGSHLHDVANLGREVAVSVHAYSPTLAQMTHYDLVDGALRPSGVEQRPAW
ncbi:cupin domain-containing protein [Janibacter indicus]|uniref:hypothetical protein n=1 Tax=Janibacter indicus TaxID=857417 RepID=UPI00299D0F6F|nr:hypothetical protein [Janibacter indicus]